eukprot:TRINITY_DN83574_c0_g1_i1.p1 TRINITY_DN83574_c0_g1~~TRINITY_DN83574_c0_g1_i1.p1  ORF type:complete len:375 (-),score=91.20 TRINITY_DN83574_c0_g1_i1:93-1217(-)
MPTKEEIVLYSKMDGGSGDPMQDAEVVKLLSKTLVVPEQNVKAFVKTRDRNTMNGIRQVLAEMPSPMKPGMTGAMHMTGMPRVSTAPGSLGASSAMTKRSMAEQRLNEMCKMQSSYSAHFCGKISAKTPPPGTKAFEHLRDEYRTSFDDWKTSAPDSQLRVFAETCRTLRFFNSPGLHSTTYLTDFPRYENMDEARCKLPQKDMTVSNVPLGNLNGGSENERKVHQMRVEKHAADIDEARAREQGIFDGTLTAPEQRMKMSTTLVSAMNAEPTKATHQMGAEAIAPSRDWKALARASWTTDVHSKTQVAKHEHSRLIMGEVSKKTRESYNKLGKVGQKRYAQKRTDIFDVRNVKDITGQQQSRFSYTKHAGFIP